VSSNLHTENSDNTNALSFYILSGFIGGVIYPESLSRAARSAAHGVQAAPGIAAESPQDLHRQIRGLGAESPATQAV
jgi:hypothetical protein